MGHCNFPILHPKVGLKAFLIFTLQFPYFASASDRLKCLWKTLKDDDKQAIWDYLNVLLFLSCEVHEKK